ncbi:hypothetical protein UlMin_016260 [Ulmus minor]
MYTRNNIGINYKYQQFKLIIIVVSKILKVGEELWKETLPLQMGSHLYQLQGLKPHTYFSLQLRIGNLNSALRVNRRLLNTEKLIFKIENIDISNQGETYVLLTVEPEGVVVIPCVPERQFIIFNIVKVLSRLVSFHELIFIYILLKIYYILPFIF